MHVALNKFLQELESLSPGFLKQIESLYGLKESDVKRLMRKNLKPGSYAAWRRRVRAFSDRRAHYK